MHPYGRAEIYHLLNPTSPLENKITHCLWALFNPYLKLIFSLLHLPKLILLTVLLLFFPQSPLCTMERLDFFFLSTEPLKEIKQNAAILSTVFTFSDT